MTHFASKKNKTSFIHILWIILTKRKIKNIFSTFWSRCRQKTKKIFWFSRPFLNKLIFYSNFHRANPRELGFYHNPGITPKENPPFNSQPSAKRLRIMLSIIRPALYKACDSQRVAKPLRTTWIISYAAQSAKKKIFNSQRTSQAPRLASYAAFLLCPSFKEKYAILTALVTRWGSSVYLLVHNNQFRSQIFKPQRLVYRLRIQSVFTFPTILHHHQFMRFSALSQAAENRVDFLPPGIPQYSSHSQRTDNALSFSWKLKPWGYPWHEQNIRFSEHS